MQTRARFPRNSADNRGTSQPIPLFKIEVRLVQNASQRANRDLRLPRHNRRVDDLSAGAGELHMAALLRDFSKSRGLKPAFDLAKWRRVKPPQLQPRPAGSSEALLPAGPRSIDREPHADSRAHRLPSRPGWLRRPPGIARRTNRPLSRRLLQTGASCTHCPTNQTSAGRGFDRCSFATG
jgi:hypothetical protein